MNLSSLTSRRTFTCVLPSGGAQGESFDAADIAAQLKAGDEIDLEGKNLSHFDAQRLAEVLRHAACPSGITLNLRHARVDDLGLKSLLNAAAASNVLAALDLHGLRTGGVDEGAALDAGYVHRIASLLGPHSSMCSLDLGDQWLSGTCWKDVDQSRQMSSAFVTLMLALAHTTTLKTLRLDGCRLRDVDLVVISDGFINRADVLRTPACWVEIGLRDNKFSAAEVQNFVSALGQFNKPSSDRLAREHLKTIDLTGAELSDEVNTLCLDLVRAVKTLCTLEPYSSTSTVCLGKTGSEIVEELDNNRWQPWRQEVLAMAANWPAGIPRELGVTVGAMILRD